jgi:hypothetical protein
MTTGRADAGIAQAATGNDVISAVSANGITLGAGDSVEVAFALIAGENLSMLEASADAAQVKYDNILSVEPINLIADNTKLSKIYPNPAGKQTRIEFTVHENASTVVEIYSLTGTKVKQLLSENIAKGTYSLIVDISDLSAGSYICRMQSGTSVSTLPLNIIR